LRSWKRRGRRRTRKHPQDQIEIYKEKPKNVIGDTDGNSGIGSTVGKI
jgi:hypothetical protein